MGRIRPWAPEPGHRSPSHAATISTRCSRPYRIARHDSRVGDLADILRHRISHYQPSSRTAERDAGTYLARSTHPAPSGRSTRMPRAGSSHRPPRERCGRAKARPIWTSDDRRKQAASRVGVSWRATALPMRYARNVGARCRMRPVVGGVLPRHPLRSVRAGPGGCRPQARARRPVSGCSVPGRPRGPGPPPTLLCCGCIREGGSFGPSQRCRVVARRDLRWRYDRLEASASAGRAGCRHGAHHHEPAGAAQCSVGRVSGRTACRIPGRRRDRRHRDSSRGTGSGILRGT